MRHWLVKAEPDEYSIEQFERDRRVYWEGVRNYQARNYLRDQLQVGDRVLFYQSKAKPSGVVGLARVSQTGLPDPSAWDPASPYFDPRSTPTKPIWYLVELEFVARCDRMVSLAAIKAEPKLANMRLAQRGDRLSVQPVEADHFHLIINLGFPNLLQGAASVTKPSQDSAKSS